MVERTTHNHAGPARCAIPDRDVRQPLRARTSIEGGSRHDGDDACRRNLPGAQMMGILIGVGSMVTLVLALSRGRKVVVLAALGAAGTFIAGVGGLRFLMAGQANGSSYLMATGFLVVVVGYVGELIVASIWH